MSITADWSHEPEMIDIYHCWLKPWANCHKLIIVGSSITGSDGLTVICSSIVQGGRHDQGVECHMMQVITIGTSCRVTSRGKEGGEGVCFPPLGRLKIMIWFHEGCPRRIDMHTESLHRVCRCILVTFHGNYVQELVEEIGVLAVGVEARGDEGPGTPMSAGL
jgi:hypothetical protein